MKQWLTLTASHLTVAYAHAIALNDLSSTFERGKVYVVMGRNGVGKTTLLRAVSGRAPIAQGSVLPALSADDWRHDHGVAAVLPDDLGVYEALTTRDLLRRLLRRRGGLGKARAQDKNLVLDIQRDLGAEILDTPQGRLSGGQRRLAACLLALVGAPSVVVADEPFVGLDPERRAIIVRYFAARAERGSAVIVTHNGLKSVLPENWQGLRLVVVDGKHELQLF